MTAMPTVSVVIGTYNSARWLGATIDSVRRQTFQDWELVIVDDGSTDDTRRVVGGHADDPRIRYVLQTRAGRASATRRRASSTQWAASSSPASRSGRSPAGSCPG